MPVPKLNHRFTRLANKLIETMATSDMTSRELKVVLHVLRQTYGYMRESSELSLSDIARGTNIARNHLPNVVNKLIEDGVLFVEHTPGGTRLLGVSKSWWHGLKSESGVPKLGTAEYDEGVPKLGEGCAQVGTKTVPELGTHKRKKERTTKITTKPLSDFANPTPVKTERMKAMFAIFWAAYPKAAHKGSKAKAEQKFLAIKGITEEVFSEMIAALERLQVHHDKAEKLGAFAPEYAHVATYIHQRRWEDELPKLAETTTSGFTANFNLVLGYYPPHRIGDVEKAWAAYRAHIKRQDDWDLLTTGIVYASKTTDWVKEGGKYVPSLANYILGQTWKKLAQPTARGLVL